jgi:hypothetical protein
MYNNHAHELLSKGEHKYLGNGAERKVAEEAYALASSTGAFGQKQAMYYDRHVSSFIDIFRMAREREGGTISSCTKLLEDMIAVWVVKVSLTAFILTVLVTGTSLGLFLSVNISLSAYPAVPKIM